MNARSFMAVTHAINGATADLEAHDAALRIAQIREAVRARPTSWPTETITLDLGELGEVPAVVEYDPIPPEPGDRDNPARPAYLILGSVTVDGITDENDRPVNLLRFIKKLHPDALAEITHKVHEKLRRGAA